MALEKHVEVLEDTHFSTGNGGLTVSLTRVYYGPTEQYPEYYLKTELSHYGTSLSGETQILDVGSLGEMIEMLQRTKARMERDTPNYYGHSVRAYRHVVGSQPVEQTELFPGACAGPDEDCGEADESIGDNTALLDQLNKIGSSNIESITVIDHSQRFPEGDKDGVKYADILVNGEWMQSVGRMNFDDGGNCLDVETLVDFLTNLSTTVGFKFDRI